MMSKLEVGLKQIWRSLSGENLTQTQALHPSVLKGKCFAIPHRIYLHQMFEELITSNNNETETAREVAIWQQYPMHYNNMANTIPEIEDFDPDGETAVTFMELNQKSNIIARILGKLLRDHGKRIVKQEDAVVGLFMQPGIDRIACQLACFKLGLAYMPLDTLLSDSSITTVLTEVEPLCILITENNYKAKQSLLDSVGNHCLVFFRDLFQNAVQRGTKAGNIQPEEILFTANDPLALILPRIYNNETGTVKMVMIYHSNIWNRIRWQWDWFPYLDYDITCHKASILTTDAIWELFGSLLRGIPVVIVSPLDLPNIDHFATIVSQKYISWIALSPTQLKSWLNRIEENPKLIDCLLSIQTVVISSGELLSPSIMQKFFEIFPSGKKVISFCGYSESCGDVTFEVFTCLNDVLINIHRNYLSVGSPIYNTDIYIANEKQHSIELEWDGEVCISGIAVSNKYFCKQSQTTKNNSSKSSKQPEGPFIENRIQPRRGFHQLYRTDDLGFIRNGKLYLKGNLKEKVEDENYQFCMTDIENKICKIVQLTECVAVCLKPDSGTKSSTQTIKHIACFYELNNNSILEPTDIISKCRSKLPVAYDFEFHQIEMMPINCISFNIDRKLLQRFYIDFSKATQSKPHTHSSQDTAPSDKTVTLIRETIANVLRTECHSELNDNDNFFDKGGTPQLALECITKLRDNNFRNANIRAFGSAISIGQLIALLKYNFVLLKSSLYLSANKLFTINQLQSGDQETTYFLAQTLIEQDPLYSCVDCPYEDLANCIEDYRQLAFDSGVSLVVRRIDNGELVGVIFAFSSENIPQLSGNESLDAVGEYLSGCRPRTKAKSGWNKLSTVARIALSSNQKPGPSSSGMTTTYSVQSKIRKAPKGTSYG